MQGSGIWFTNVHTNIDIITEQGLFLWLLSTRTTTYFETQTTSNHSLGVEV